jgi:tRNA threonylcarbamoyladenosine biosynthesis protein TsaB
MRVLALDTSRRDGSVALIDGNRVVEERRGDPSRTQAERLPRDILTLLDAHGTKSSEIDLFAVASGPGSFTGLRIGIATIQGLAFVHGRRIAAVSALEAMTQAVALGLETGTLVGAWMDAQRREVFSALYRIGPGPADVVEVEAAAVHDPVATLSLWNHHLHGPVVFVGDGAMEYGDLVRSARPEATLLEPPVLAGTIGLIAVSRAAAGQTLEPAAVRPLYVRRPDAEIDRDRKASTVMNARPTKNERP